MTNHAKRFNFLIQLLDRLLKIQKLSAHSILFGKLNFMVYDNPNRQLMPDSKKHMIITGFNPLNTQNCILNDARIDLWQFSLAYELHNADQLLNSEEQARANRFYFSRH